MRSTSKRLQMILLSSNSRLWRMCAFLLSLGTCEYAHALDRDEIVAKHIEACGGKTNLSALRSLRLEGKISFGDGDFLIDLLWSALFKRPGMLREDASLQGLTGISAYDGKEGWQVQ